MKKLRVVAILAILLGLTPVVTAQTYDLDTIICCDSLQRNYRTYTQTGTYEDTVRIDPTHSNDSIVLLHVIVNHSSEKIIYTASCGNYSVGQFLHDSTGTYIDTLYNGNAKGCDSIVHLHLIINHQENTLDTVTTCDSYIWRQTTYTISGDYFEYVSMNRPITIGEGSESNFDLPIHNDAAHSFSQTFYTAREINVPQGGQIDTLWFYRTMQLPIVKNITDTLVRIYLAHTQDSFAANNKSWIPQENLEIVFHGPIVQRSSDTGWFAIPLQRPFFYNGFDNLALVTSVHTYRSTAISQDQKFRFRYSQGVNGVSLQRSDNVTPEYGEYPDTTQSLGAVSRTNHRPDLRLSIRQGQCDTSLALHLTVNYSTTFDTTAIALESFTWRGNTYTESDTIVNIIQNAVGCDSTETLYLTINYYKRDTISDTACEQYLWRGYTLTESGFYSDTVVAVDSIYNLNLTINHGSFLSFVDTACDNYTWVHFGDTLSFTTSGTYTDNYFNNVSCPSVDTLFLTIKQSTTFDTTIYEYESYSWHGSTYTTTTIVIDTLQNSVGCDSITTLNLFILQYTHDTIIDTACDLYTWHGDTLVESGFYVDTVINFPLGADTIYYLDLTILHSTHNDTSATVCDLFEWIHYGDTLTYTASGIYTDDYINEVNCASTDTLHLTVKYSTTFDTSVSAREQFTWHDSTYTASAIVVDTVPNAVGCDSITTLYLTIAYYYRDTLVDSSCEQYVWRGRTITSSGHYIDTVLNYPIGRDTIYSLYLTILHGTFNDTSVVACNSFDWIQYGDTLTFTSEGTYTHSYINAVGCPSTDTLHLTLRGTYYDTTVVACNEFYWVNHGDTLHYVASGTYTHPYFNSHNCPSVDTLHLTINTSSYDEQIWTACDEYTWNDHGNSYYCDSTGIYENQYLNDSHCESSTILYLTILHSSDSVFTDTVCDYYYWHGHTYYASTDLVQFDTINAVGCDSTVTLNLTVHYSTSSTTTLDVCDSLIWHGHTYATTTYEPRYDTLNAQGCDSAEHLHLTVHHTDSTEFDLSIGGSYVWHGTTYTTSGDYTRLLHNIYGCDSTVTLHLTILPHGEGALSGLFSVSPTQQVYFSRGNLQQMPSDNKWRFALHQYDFVGSDNSQVYSRFTGWIDLFGWGTSGHHNPRDPFNTNYQPWSTSIATVSSQFNSHGYGPSTNMEEPNLVGLNAAYDWGMINPIINGGNQAGQWRTLSYNEWTYLLEGRENADDKNGMGTVNGVKGAILIPDVWEQPDGVPVFYPGLAVYNQYSNINTYTADQWEVMQASGAAFLPTAGNRFGVNVSSTGTYGYYWSATHADSYNAYAMVLLENSSVTDAYFRYIGRSVRLVQDVLEDGIPCNTIGDTAVYTPSDFWWFGTNYAESGDYSHTLLGSNSHGCDSIVTLHLIIGNDGISRTSKVKQYIVTTEGSSIVVIDAIEQPIRVFDVVGRLVEERQKNLDTKCCIKVPATGVYVVKVGNSPATKVVVKY